MNAITKPGDDRTCTDGLRNRFFQRKRMRAEDFKIEQDYLIGRRRMISRSVLGSGVVYGFAMEGAGKAHCREPDRPSAASEAAQQTTDTQTETVTQQAPAAKSIVLKVGPGLALDAGGRESLLSVAANLTAENTFILVKANGMWCARRLDADLKAGRYVLAVHYAERKAGETVMPAFCCHGDGERTHLCETVLFSLRALDDCECACGEPECPCGEACVCDACDGRRHNHARLVEWATKRDFSRVSMLRPWDCFEVAVDDPVDLACIEIGKPPEKCKPLEFTWIDASSPRRLVMTNDSLFDLIRGCGLTHIQDVSWRDWHRKRAQIEWADFATYFTTTEYGPDSLLTKFTVTFSGPVVIDTLRRDTIAITVQMVDGGTGWVRSRRVPITALDTKPSSQDLPPGTTNQFSVAVAKRWVRDEIDQGGESYLSERDFVVEIEIRGDLIEDCNGQTVDANSDGLRPSPSGNGTPGGTYFSSFKVKRSMRRESDDSERTGS